MKKILLVLCLISCALFGCSNQKELETYKTLEEQGLKLNHYFIGDKTIGIGDSSGYKGFTWKIKDDKVLFLIYSIEINNKSEYFLIAGEKKYMYEFNSGSNPPSKSGIEEAKEEYKKYESQVKKAYEKFMKDNNLTDEDIEDLMLYIYEHDGDLGED